MVLNRYRDEVPSFNDDIQGTGAVALAGVISACQQKRERLRDQRVVVLGAGAGGIGVAWALIEGLVRDGVSREEARKRVFVLDSKGLLIEGRSMESYKAPYAQPADAIAGWRCDGEVPTLMEVIENAAATVLLGLSGQASAFNKPVVGAVARNTARPVVFPLSNPTSIAEALPEDVFKWTDGRAIVATGSPFEDVMFDGRSHSIGQGNNAFIFPGLGFAAILVEAKRITDGMVLESAFALADYTNRHHGASGCVYPPVKELQDVSLHVAARVVERALEEGVAGNRSLEDGDIAADLRQRFWHPEYLPFVRGG